MLKRLLRPVAWPLVRLVLRWRLYRCAPVLWRIRAVRRRGDAIEAPRWSEGMLESIPLLGKHCEPVPMLKGRHIRNCRLAVDRYELLEHVPKGGVCAEIGIWRGDYSARILEVTQPRVLHLLDNSADFVSNARKRFGAELQAGKVELHLGDSSKVVSGLDVRFDWVYIDGDHSYDGCRKDLAAVRPKMRPGGWIVLNDYTYMSPGKLFKFGVIEAANEFCLEHDYEMIYMALNAYGYNDVALRPIGAGGKSPGSAG